jgi:hypothetical protein
VIALAQNIRKNGFDYVQLLRGRKACIYVQRLKESVIGYEVFRIRTSPVRKILGKSIEERELFPHNEAFGYTAWSTRTLERASAIFKELETRQK